jgi:uncharacterized LabA/DUF88 family protein
VRSYCSLYVDAGYLIAAASTRVTGTSLRSATEVDVPGLLTELTEQVEADSGLPLLRIHWYDSGTRQGAPSGSQRDIATLPKVKLRLGRVGFNGEQKGVDLKLALDLITQSRNKAAEVVYLVSGDDDLSEAVEEAQHHGVQVISLVVPDEQGQAISVSQNLQMTVDQLQLIRTAVIDDHVKKSPSAAMKEVAEASVVAKETAAQDTPPRSPVVAVPPRPGPTPTPVARPLPGPPIVRPLTAAPLPAYSTSTGTGGAYGTHTALDDHATEAIGDVVDKVVINWWRGASEASRHELLKGKPLIPSDMDRALLSDLSNKLAIYDIPQDWRFALREAFWAKIGRL